MRNKYFIVIAFCMLTATAFTQKKLGGGLSGSRKSTGTDSTDVKGNNGYDKLATIDMYVEFNGAVDSIEMDTTISIKKEYKFNYLQKDIFGLMPFANIGQTYNTLSFNSFNSGTVPLFGSRSKHFNYLEHEDIKFYEVATPFTRLTYKTAFEQGQMLDAFITVNLSKQFNFSIAYKGLRSLGNYQNALTSAGNFRFTSNYKSKNKRYIATGYVVMQDLLNQENGGLKTEDLENFTSGNEEFIDRSVFDPNFEDAENILEGKRFFLEHSYLLTNERDSLHKNELKIYNTISFEDKFYEYTQTSAADEYFGEFFNSSINDRVTLENFNTSLGLKYNNAILGDIRFAVNYTDANYGYNSVVLLDEEYIPNRIKYNFAGLEGAYSKSYKGFRISGNGGVNLSDIYVGSYLEGNIKFTLNKDILIMGAIGVNSRLPNYNHLLYQSDYLNYNWYNLDSFNNINTQQLKFSVLSDKYFNTTVDISNIENYTFFNSVDTTEEFNVIKPEQYDESLQYLRVKVQKEFKFGNFALDNTILYQNVISDSDVLNVPALITRNTIYYSNELFKKSMRLQIGITSNYFSEYNMNGYDPLLSEFYTQNETKLGGFPRLDFFINAKVRQTRIFLKAEHFNSSFTGYDYFSAPNQPYRDFTIRFGLVWDFFL